MIRRSDLHNVLRGLLMGGADIIPGVSGGTMALILGIYHRLVTAISRFDMTFVGFLRQGHYREAAAHVDFRFLLFLGLGIGTGIVALSGLIHYLFDHELQRTLGAFFGMIVASVWLVVRLIDRWTPVTAVALVAGSVFAFWLVGLPFLENPPESLWYLFFCGMIAICAMILPGVSGAFILLVLGKYIVVTGALKDTVKGAFSLDFDGGKVLTVIVFSCGAVIGLLSFSRVLRFVLDRFESVTMAILAGFMLGSLRKIWPYKQEISEPGTKLSQRVYENLMPDFAVGETWTVLVIALVAGAFVLALEYTSTRRAQRAELDA